MNRIRDAKERNHRSPVWSASSQGDFMVSNIIRGSEAARGLAGYPRSVSTATRPPRAIALSSNGFGAACGDSRSSGARAMPVLAPVDDIAKPPDPQLDTPKKGDKTTDDPAVGTADLFEDHGICPTSCGEDLRSRSKRSGDMIRLFKTPLVPSRVGNVYGWLAVLSGVHHLSYPAPTYLPVEYHPAFSMLVGVAEFVILLFLLRAVLGLAAHALRRVLQRGGYELDEAGRASR
jgi:hypothetical protein